MRQKTNPRTCAVILLLLLTAISPAAGRVIYTDRDATGANDGSSWADAYNYLQDALTDANASAKPVEIRVAQGAYKPDEDSLHPDGTGDREATFQLITGVTLKGGYAGFGQPDPNARDVALYETTLSGDLGSNDREVDDPADLGSEPSRAENSYHVVTARDTDETAVLDGISVTAGNADDAYPNNNGGGMCCDYADPVLTNCTFKANSADGMGGGVFNYWSDPVMSGCAFIGNSTDYDGGGIFNWMSRPVLVNCTFIRNSAMSNGGGIFTNHGSFRSANCTFSKNSAGNWGGGIFNAKLYGVVTLANCIFWGNDAYEGPQIAIARRVMGGTATFMDYCDVQGGELDVYDPDGLLNWGQGNIESDPCFVDEIGDDYHLKSQAGRWDPNSETWVKDDVTSSCIDAGDPMSPVGDEPFSNGGIVNMGAYGGTAEASKSYFDKPLCEVVVAGDINGDCEIDFKDFFFVALHWLEDH